MGVLNDQNRAETERVCREAVTNRKLVDHLRGEIEMHRKSAEWLEGMLREAERIRDGYNREIKALGYHDIGHARTELGNEEKQAGQAGQP
jgi:hypothetical protein